MPARKGVAQKSSRWAFVIDCEQFAPDLIDTALLSQGISGAVSPLHDLDAWDRADIYKYMLSRFQARNGVLFFYDECFEPSNGFTYKEAVQRPDLPLFASWSIQNGKPRSDSYKGDSKYFPIEDSGCFHICTLPALGEKKKDHKHVQVYFPANPIPWSTVFNRLELGGITEDMLYYIEPVNNWEGLLRYYPHLDNPEKAQYNLNDVHSFYGFDLSPLYRKSEAGKVAEFEMVYATVRSMGSDHVNLLSVTDAFMRSGRPEIAKAISSRAGYWREIIYQMQHEHFRNERVEKEAEADLLEIVDKLNRLDSRVENLE